MPQFNLDSSDLLTYEPIYRVLICRECQYAIQKSAVQSHLLRHKIYRDDRQQLVFAIEQLDLPEPEDVQLPPPTSAPVDGLPVIDGFRCAVPGCGSLCASIKRMKKHHTDVHGNSDHARTESGWDSVKLQTFFKGQKIRYFEVGASLARRSTATHSISQVSPNLDGVDADPEEQEEPMDGLESTWPPPGETPTNSIQVSLSSGIDLEVLSHFHHYTTNTCRTLPTSVFQIDYWRNEMVALALKQEWMMAGVLAITACHLTIQEAEIATSQRYLEKSYKYGASFCRVFDRAFPDPESEATLLKTTGYHIACILRCAQWAAQSVLSPEISPSNPFNLQSFMELTRNTTFEDPDREAKQIDVFAHGRVILDKLPRNYIEPSTIPKTTPELRLYMLNRYRSLTFSISETLGRPAAVNDVIATLSAIAALVTCCELSFASEEISVTWRALALWPKRVPDYFVCMVKEDNSAALVLVAYWTWLIQRAEERGCWFLKGIAKRIFMGVEQKLETENSGVRKLIDGLGDIFR